MTKHRCVWLPQTREASSMNRPLGLCHCTALPSPEKLPANWRNESHQEVTFDKDQRLPYPDDKHTRPHAVRPPSLAGCVRLGGVLLPVSLCGQCETSIMKSTKNTINASQNDPSYLSLMKSAGRSRSPYLGYLQPHEDQVMNV